MHLLPFPLLLLIQSALAARPNSAPEITGTTVLDNLLPPYPHAPSAAKYYASIAGVQPLATLYAITCVPPSSPISSPGTATQSGTGNACQPNAPSRTFAQGASTWYSQNYNSRDVSVVGDMHYTACNMRDWAPEVECNAMDRVDGVTKWGEGEAGIFGLGVVDGGVTVTGGWDLLGDPGTKVRESGTSTSLSEYGFTDIGATRTTAGPVVTITVVRTQPGAGVKMRVVDRRLLGVAWIGVWLLFIAL